MPPFEKSVAVVTGASRGIGAAIAKKLANNDSAVVLVGRDEELLKKVQQEIEGAGGFAAAQKCDITSTEEVQALVETIRSTYERCDLLVNCAGIGRMGRLTHDTPLTDFDAMFATNVRGPFLLMQGLTPLMIARGGGQIINISSLAGKNPLPNGAAYAASKWALHGLTYSAAEELRSYGIKVSIVAPGSVATDFNQGSSKDPSKKLQAEDIAEVVAMLARQKEQTFISEVLVRPLKK